MHWMLVPLKRYAEFSGRSRRTEYWMFQLFMALVYVAMIMLMLVVGGGGMAMAGGDPSAMLAAGGAMMVIGGLYLLFLLAMIIPGIAVTVRRLHDTDRSGWWILAPLSGYVIMGIAAITSGSGDSSGVGGILAVVGLIAVMGLGITLLVFMFLEGTRGPNRFGPDPKGEALDKVFA
jgi:uncharacterized membrane protein YhaH (DUF805 family)